MCVLLTSDDNSNGRQRRQRRQQCAADSFKKKWNGSLTEPKIQHYCESFECCRGYDYDYLVEQLATTYVAMFLPGAPVVPVASKWTKVGPAVDYAFAGNAVNGMLQAVMVTAFSDLKIPSEAEIGVIGDTEDLDYRKVCGVRWGNCKRDFASETFNFTLVVLALCIEPTRSFHFAARPVVS